MSNADRHRLIARAVTESGSATVPELAELTGASEMSIRRDLGTLAAQVPSSAFAAGRARCGSEVRNPPSRCAPTRRPTRSAGIASEVSRLIADGETVLLDSGTTCLEVARLLRGRPVR